MLGATSTADLDELCDRLRTATTAVLAPDPGYEPLPFWGHVSLALHQPAVRRRVGDGAAGGARRGDAERLGAPADAGRGHPPRPALPVERARLAAAHGAGPGATRARNRSRSTTTRVTSPCATTLSSGACSATTSKRSSRPSTYPTRRGDPDRGAHRAGPHVLELHAGPDAGLLVGSAPSTAAQVAASHQASSRGVASTARLARPQRERGVLVGDGELQGRAVARSHRHPASARSCPIRPDAGGCENGASPDRHGRG